MTYEDAFMDGYYSAMESLTSRNKILVMKRLRQKRLMNANMQKQNSNNDNSMHGKYDLDHDVHTDNIHASSNM